MGVKKSRLDKIETSVVVTVAFVVLFFLTSIGITLVAPRFVDHTWLTPTSSYMQQMYEVVDPNLYISNSATGTYELQYTYRLEEGKSLLAFIETERLRFIAEPALEKYITRFGDKETKLTTRLLLTRRSNDETTLKNLQETFDQKHPEWRQTGPLRPDYEVFEVYDPGVQEAFVFSDIDGGLEDYIDQNFRLVDEAKEPWHTAKGVIFVKNPKEYRVTSIHTPFGVGFRYAEQGRAVSTLEELTSLGFASRKELIQEGEHLYAIEGCWYCHTDQTRTLVQDVVLNGSDSYPAPPSSASEYIYQNVTFPGTKRNGPDLSRTGVKRPGRDWHKSHFWSPKTVSKGSIMPAFFHFFDHDPRGTAKAKPGVPNRKFEAMYQYLMTKGTRITPPTEAWWLGKDPIHTKELIEGKR